MQEIGDRLRTAGDSVADAALLAGVWSRADGLGMAPKGLPPGECRLAASAAIARIDEALWTLHSARAELIGQTRRADDAHGRHVDALLAARRSGRGVQR